MEIFYDNLDIIDDEPIEVVARVTLLSTEEGGRHSPIQTKIRPNHNFGSPENKIFFIGQLELKENEQFFPGETKEITIKFLKDRDLMENLTVGNSWRIQEGSRLIGIAKVLKVKKE